MSAIEKRTTVGVSTDTRNQLLELKYKWKDEGIKISNADDVIQELLRRAKIQGE